MRLHSQQDLKKFVADLRKKHPRLVVLFGEQHHSPETHKLIQSVLEGADVGFFEQSHENPSVDRETAKARLEAHREHGSDPETLSYATMLAAPKHCVFVDECEEIRQRPMLARNALKRAADDGAGMDDPVVQAIAAIAHGRVEDRFVSSNKHMAEKIGEYLNREFPMPKPFFAAAVVGGLHLHPKRFGAQGSASDLKHALREAGFDVVSIEISPVKQPQRRQRDGSYTIASGSLDEPSIDFSISMVDRTAISEKSVTTR